MTGTIEKSSNDSFEMRSFLTDFKPEFELYPKGFSLKFGGWIVST